MKKFFLEQLAGYVFEKGLDALIDFVRDSYPGEWPELDKNERAILQHFQGQVPNTYQRVGVLFEVYVFREGDGRSAVIIPVSFGDTPTNAYINDMVFNDKDLQELPAEVKEEWVKDRLKMTELSRQEASDVEKSAFWWEYDRTTRKWSVRHADYRIAQDQAKRAIDNGISLAELSKAASTINGLRANAAQWLNLRELAETRIRDAKVRSRIQALVDENERMVLQIDEALEDMKRAQEYQSFLDVLNLFGSALSMGAQLSTESSDATRGRMVALENHSITVIERAGNEMRRLDLELKNLFGGYIDNTEVMPSYDIRTIRKITHP